MLDDLIEKLKNYRLYVILGVGLLGVGLFFLWQIAAPKADETVLPALSSASTSQLASSTERSSASQSKNDRILVDIEGAVAQPGVYELDTDSRVKDAVAKAGGLTADANRQSVNLAQKLKDEDVIVVAKVGEELTNTSATAGQASSSSSSGKVNLNKASLEDLQKLSGIGQKRAQDILDYRDSKGGFKSLDDLKNVSGIGDKTLEKLKDEVTVD